MKYLAIALSSTILAACGGGGSSGSDAPALPTAEPAVSLPGSTIVPNNGLSSIVMTAAASTYAVGSEEFEAYNKLNSERLHCGFGALTQNSSLDAAAKSHADYQGINNLQDHLQSPSLPGFTGISPGDRLAAAGYPNPSTANDEMVKVVGFSTKNGFGAIGVMELLNAPFHMRGMLGEGRDVGIAVRNSVDVNSPIPSVITQFDIAYTKELGPQLFASDEVNTYPCEGTSGSHYKLENETPNPVEGRDLKLNPLGSSIYISLRLGNTLAITKASIKQVSNSSMVNLRVPVTSSNSGNMFRSHEGYVVADQPMLPSTSYLATIEGTNNSVYFKKAFTFTTAANQL